MEKGITNKKTIAISVLLIAFITSPLFFIRQKPAVLSSIAPSTTVRQQTQNPNLTYKGQLGKDALTILKQKADMEQDKSGLVISINGHKADNANHEYWAFYINNKMAEIGPAQYQTKDTDIIKWQIEKY